MSTFIVFAGPNGSGKSSARDAIVNPVEVVIDPDQIAREINPADSRSVDNQAGRKAIERFERSLSEGRSMSMETTLTGHSAVMRLQRAKDAGYDVSLIYVALDNPELNVVRVKERARRGGHDIDPVVVRRRVRTSLGNLPQALAIADQTLVLDNSGSEHHRILETAAGRVTYLAEQLPTWLNDQMPDIMTALKNSPAPAPDAAPAKPKRSAVAGIFDALRRPEPATPPPWAPPPVPMAERLAAFERIAAERASKPGPAPSGPEAEPEIGPRPSSGSKP